MWRGGSGAYLPVTSGGLGSYQHLTLSSPSEVGGPSGLKRGGLGSVHIQPAQDGRVSTGLVVLRVQPVWTRGLPRGHLPRSGCRFAVSHGFPLYRVGLRFVPLRLTLAWDSARRSMTTTLAPRSSWSYSTCLPNNARHRTGVSPSAVESLPVNAKLPRLTWSRIAGRPVLPDREGLENRSPAAGLESFGASLPGPHLNHVFTSMGAASGLARPRGGAGWCPPPPV